MSNVRIKRSRPRLVTLHQASPCRWGLIGESALLPRLTARAARTAKGRNATNGEAWPGRGMRGSYAKRMPPSPRLSTLLR
jgi:hypothetical protein